MPGSRGDAHHGRRFGAHRHPLARLTASGAVLALFTGLLALVVLPVVDTPWADTPAADAVPGNPGVMEAPTVFYFENFENVTWQEPNLPGGGTNPGAWDAADYVQTLTEYPLGSTGDQPGYVNADGTTYSADPFWAAGNSCNGIVVAAHGSYVFGNLAPDVPLPTPGPATGCGTGATGQRWFNSLRILAGSMGQYHLDPSYPYADQDVGTTPSNLDNHVVSSFTAGDAPAGQTTMLAFDEAIPADPGRYYQFSIDIATQSCIVANNTGALPQISVTQGGGSPISAFGTTFNTCTNGGTGFVQYGPGAGGNAVGQQRTTRVGTYVGNTPIRSTGTSLGVQVDNLRITGTGNDTAFDNIVLIDTTPKLDKQFSAGPVPVGTPASLTYTVTNTHLPGAPTSPSGPKPDFSFTDVFNDPNLRLTGTSSTTCGNGVVTTDPATGTVTLSGGDLAGANLTTCTVTVGVTSDVVGTYTNGPGDFTALTGLNPPGDTEVSFFDDAFDCGPQAYLFQNAPVDQFEVNLVSGTFAQTRPDLYPQGINAIGYNPLDDYIYGYITGTSPEEFVRITQGGTVQNLGTPPDWAEVPAAFTNFNVGEFDDQGHLWLANGSPSPLQWVEIDLDPDSPTYFQVLGSGQVALPGVTLNVSDWGFDPISGTFLALVPASAGGPRIIRFNPSNGALTVIGVPGQLVGPNGVANPQGSAWGAAYTTPDGFLYMSNNTTGQIWRIDMATPTTAEFVAYGPTSNSNDGTRCPAAPLPIDWGDAPDSYDTLLASGGPFHGVVPTLAEPQVTIGDSVTIEQDGRPDSSASLDEDDAFTDEPIVPIDTAETSLSIPITNNSGQAAALAGWIDFDQNGTFQDDERAAIDAGTTTGVATLTWAVPADAVPGPSYLRLRTALGPPSGLPTDTSQSGPGAETGEVEDWPITLAELPDDFGDAPDSYGTLLAAGGASHAVVDYDETTNTAPLMLGDATTVDVEEDGAPTLGADGDDTAGVDDEGSITESVTATVDTDLTVQVAATNDATEDATLVAWFDGDLDGVFDTGEASPPVTVPAGSGLGAYDVTMPAAPTAGDTYLRVRLFAGTNDDPQPTGAWTGGEVEDYLVTIEDPELTVTKTSDVTGSVTAGDTVTYTVTIQNTGTADYTETDPASFIDDLSDVLDDAAYGDDAAVDPVQGEVQFTDPTLSWSGPLAVGESVEVTYSVTVGDPPAGDGVLANTVVAPDSTCAEDAQPPDPACTVTLPVRSLEIEKTSDSVTTLVPGQTIDYSFTVTNTGGFDYTTADPAVVDDDLSAVLDDAAYNGDAVVEPAQGDVSYTAPTLSWSGPLAAGDSVKVDYSVTVDDPITGDLLLTNVVTGPPESNCPAGADPSDPDCTVVLPAPGLDIVKSAQPSAGPLLPGDTVTYTVELTNTGQTDYPADAPARFTDDLTEVLDDAVWNDDVTVDPDSGTVQFNDPELEWSGPLAAGATVTISYSVTVDDPISGDGILTNAVTGPPESNCLDGTEAGCTTSTPVRALAIAKSSDATGPVLPGDTVTYTVTVENTGGAPYTQAEPAVVSDDLTDVLDDASFNGDVTVDPDQGVASFSDLALTWSGPLAVGESVTITYSVTVDDPLSGDGILTNAVTGPPESNCLDGTEEGCTTSTPVRSLTITKTSDATGAVVPGDTVTYTVTIENAGGAAYTQASPTVVSDDLTAVLDDATWDDNLVVTPDQGEASFTDPTLTWSGPLAAGASVMITYSVTVDDPTTGDAVLTNAVTGPPESNCLDGTEAGCTTSTPVRALAISKTSVPAGAVLPGDTVTYTVAVENTGGTAYTNTAPAVVSDDLTDVLDDASYNGDVTIDPDQGVASFTDLALTWSGPLAVGESVTITYSVTVDHPLSGDGILTNAVTGPPESNCLDGTEEGCATSTPVRSLTITKTSDATGAVVPGDTVTYSVTIENAGGAAYSDANPAVVSDDLTAVLDDATWDDNLVVTPDQGEASFTDPTLTWSGPLAAGETVTITYSVTVDDPITGDGLLTNAVTGPPESNCLDGTEDGCTTSTPVRALQITKTAEPTDVVTPGDTVTYTVTVENTGGAAYTEASPAVVSDDLTAVLDDASYNGDVTVDPDQGVASFTDPTLTWTGPLAVGESVTITYSVTVDDPTTGDGILTNAVTGPPESNCDDGTEPGCAVTVPPRELSINKTVSLAGAVLPGDTVTYTLTVENTGEAPYTDDSPAVVTDDLSQVLDDATWDDNVVVTPGQGVATFADPTLTWSGPLAVGETVTISYSVTVDDPITGNAVLTNTVTGPPESNCDDGTEEGCTTSTPVRSLTITKTSDTTGAVVPGDTVTYTVTVENTGGAAYTEANPAVVSDDLTAVLDDATWNDNLVVTPDQGEASFADPTLTWSGPLAVGASVTITYSVTVNDPLSGDGELVNAVTGPPESNCLDGTEDGCTTSTPVRALAIAKSSDATGPVLPGDTVTYTVTVENTGGAPYTQADPAVVSDDLTAVLDDASFNGDVTVDPDQGVASFTDPTLTWTGPLPVGETVTITYSVTVDDPITGDGLLTNTVTGPPESNCDDGTEEGCTTSTPVRALAIAKSSDATGPVLPGDTVTYTVTVENTGGAPYTQADPAVVSDDLTAVLDDASFNGDVTVDPDQGVASFTDPTLTWTGPLPVGASVTITYLVTVDDPTTGDGLLTNAVTGPPESNCLDGTENGCTTSTPVRALTITKTSDTTGPVVPGDTVSYTVTIENTGGAPYAEANPAVVSDDLTAVLDDATWNDNLVVTPDQGESSFTDPTLTWTGPLAAGETVTITYSVTVDDPTTGNGILTNAVTGPPESNCLDGTEDGCTTSTPVRALTIAKSTDATGPVLPGDTVTYTVTVENTGGAAYTEANPAVVSDDLTAVLDDASYNGDVTVDPDQGVASFTDPTLTWTGPLAVGETVTITYSVTVNDPLSSDGELVNAVTGPPESNCLDGTEDGCTTSTPVRALAIAKSSDATDPVLPGDTVTYTVTVENTGGAAYTEANPAVVSDDLTDVLDDASFNGDVTVDPDQGVASFTDPTLTWTGPLAVGETVTITYSVTVNDPLSSDGELVNAVTGPPESNCLDGTEDGCTTSTPVRALAISKTSVPAGAVLPGDAVTYTVTIENTGGAPYTETNPAVVSDDLTAVLDDATWDDNLVVTPDQGEASFTDPTLTWTGPLPVGETVTITYSVTVDDPTTGDGLLTNTVTGPPESNCLNGTEDGCTVTVTVEEPDRGLEIIKSNDGGSFALPGATVAYTVAVTNTGGAAYTANDPAAVVDDLTQVLDDATFNDDGAIRPDTGTLAYDRPTLTWSGPLAPGETVTITYSITVDDPVTGDGVLTNAVTGPPESNCFPESGRGALRAGRAVAPGCTSNVLVRQFEVAKEMDTTAPGPGDVVRYTLTVENTGGAPYTGARPAQVRDNLAHVLDDATWIGARATGGRVRYREPELRWSGPLAVGTTVTIRYAVRVNPSATGDGKLTNTVSPSAPGGRCVDDDPGNCSTNGRVTVPREPWEGHALPDGGAGRIGLPLLIGLLLVTAGGLLVQRGRRRKT